MTFSPKPASAHVANGYTLTAEVEPMHEEARGILRDAHVLDHENPDWEVTAELAAEGIGLVLI